MSLTSVLEAVKRRFGGQPRGAAAPLAVEAQAPSLPVLDVRASSIQPQSDREIHPIVEALRRIDPLLDIRWNAEARLLEAGSYTTMGKLTPPKYEGRWQVIRALSRDDQRHYDGRTYIVVCEVTEPKREDSVLYMERHGAYAPIGDWLIEYMHAADTVNMRQFEELRRRIWAQNDAVEQSEEEIDDAMAREGLNRAQFKANFAGGIGNWHPVKASLSQGKNR